MFGSMRRIRRERRNRTNISIRYEQPISDSDVYYSMYLSERRRRKRLEIAIDGALRFIEKSKIIPDESKKGLRQLLNFR